MSGATIGCGPTWASAYVAQAKKAAQQLQNIVSQKAKPVKINGEQYLEFEDWQTIGSFYGITADACETCQNTTPD